MARSLILAGAVLFLFGLVQGGLVQFHFNPRMALSAHLTAVQSGTALMVAGAVWSLVRLPVRLHLFARWLLIVSTYGLWLALTIAALTGANQVLPIAGNGFGASGATEAFVTLLVGFSSTTMIAGWSLLVFGLLRQERR